MNRQEIIEAYNLPTIYQTEDFKDAYRAIQTLVGNKDRAYIRLVKNGGTVNRRPTKKSALPSVESFEAGAAQD